MEANRGNDIPGVDTSNPASGAIRLACRICGKRGAPPSFHFPDATMPCTSLSGGQVSAWSVQIETCDRGGTFLGNLEVPGHKHFDLGLGLLEAGLGSLHPSFDASRVSNGTALMRAEAAAKSGKRKVSHILSHSQDPASVAISRHCHTLLHILIDACLDTAASFTNISENASRTAIAIFKLRRALGINGRPALHI